MTWIITTHSIRKLLTHLPWSKHPKPYTYVAVRQPRTISWYATEIIAVEAILIAVGVFLLGGVVAEHDRVYIATESLRSDINKVMTITTYLACLFLMTGLVALRFYKHYKGLPVILAIVAFVIAALGYVEYDNVLMNIQAVE